MSKTTDIIVSSSTVLRRPLCTTELGWAGLGCAERTWVGKTCASSDHAGRVAGAATQPGTLTEHLAWETGAFDCVGLLYFTFDFGFN